MGKLCAVRATVRATKVAGLRLCTTVLTVFAHMTARVGETRSCAAAQRQKCQPANGLWSWSTTIYTITILWHQFCSVSIYMGGTFRWLQSKA